MEERKLTDFGLAVKTRLLQLGRGQKWLQQQIRERTGMFMDSGYLYKILTGQRCPEGIIRAMKEILGMDSTTV